jgi:hypothetical protein
LGVFIDIWSIPFTLAGGAGLPLCERPGVHLQPQGISDLTVLNNLILILSLNLSQVRIAASAKLTLKLRKIYSLTLSLEKFCLTRRNSSENDIS